MKIVELRIGNLINFVNEEKKVLAITDKYVSSFTIDNINPIYNLIEDCKGIKLNKEWLLKFGFEYDKYTNEYNIGLFIIVQFRLGIDLRERFEFFSNDFNPELKYVHQLQNLYFTLTNTELKLI